jgi:hypothetical protein
MVLTGAEEDGDVAEHHGAQPKAGPPALLCGRERASTGPCFAAAAAAVATARS